MTSSFRSRISSRWFSRFSKFWISSRRVRDSCSNSVRACSVLPLISSSASLRFASISRSASRMMRLASSPASCLSRFCRRCSWARPTIRPTSAIPSATAATIQISTGFPPTSVSLHETGAATAAQPVPTQPSACRGPAPPNGAAPGAEPELPLTILPTRRRPGRTARLRRPGEHTKREGSRASREDGEPGSGCDTIGRALSGAARSQRAGEASGITRDATKRNPYHCAVCCTLFEPGSPGGHPANALGFPSTTADRPAHGVLGGIPVLRVLAQKKLPHHAHGRGSRYATPLISTLTQAEPRCKPFSAAHQAMPPAVGHRSQPSIRRPRAAAMPRSLRSAPRRPARAGGSLRPV